MNQILRVSPKLNIYINTPTPFADPYEVNHENQTLQIKRTEGEALPKPTRTPGNRFALTNTPT